MLIAHGHRRDDALSYYQRGLQTLPTRRLPANMGSATITARPLQGEIEVKADTVGEVVVAGLAVGAGVVITSAIIDAMSRKRR